MLFFVLQATVHFVFTNSKSKDVHQVFQLTKVIKIKKVKMKRIFLLALSLWSLSINAQSDSTNLSIPKTTQTLAKVIKPKVKKIGLYVASDAQFFASAGNSGFASGATGALIFNERFSVGLHGAMSEAFTPTDLNNPALKLNYALAGAHMEYTFAPHRLVHVTFPLFVGAGSASIDSLRTYRYSGKGHNDDWGGNRYNRNDYNSFFVVQPGLRLEMNVIRFVKVYIGANYRAVIGDNNVTYPVGASRTNVTNAQLSGISLSAGLKVGFFDFSSRKKGDK